MDQYPLISKVTKEQKLSWRLFLLFSVLVLSILPLYRYQNYGGWPIGELVYDHTRLGKAFFNLEIPERNKVFYNWSVKNNSCGEVERFGEYFSPDQVCENIVKAIDNRIDKFNSDQQPIL
ncbi:MAG: hypothetical protein AABX98_01095, partial [Nanoarchaeota archaeon]